MVCACVHARVCACVDGVLLQCLCMLCVCAFCVLQMCVRERVLEFLIGRHAPCTCGKTLAAGFTWLLGSNFLLLGLLSGHWADFISAVWPYAFFYQEEVDLLILLFVSCWQSPSSLLGSFGGWLVRGLVLLVGCYIEGSSIGYAGLSVISLGLSRMA